MACPTIYPEFSEDFPTYSLASSDASSEHRPRIKRLFSIPAPQEASVVLGYVQGTFRQLSKRRANVIFPLCRGP
jgi:hypothetical protein